MLLGQLFIERAHRLPNPSADPLDENFAGRVEPLRLGNRKRQSNRNAGRNAGDFGQDFLRVLQFPAQGNLVVNHQVMNAVRPELDQLGDLAGLGTRHLQPRNGGPHRKDMHAGIKV